MSVFQQDSSIVVYSGTSPLKNPRAFVSDCLHDVKHSLEPASRIFQQTIAQKYRHSKLGIFWALAPAAITALLLTLGRRADVTILRDSTISPALYAVFGLVMAQTFLETVTTQRLLFSTNRFLLNRHRTPMEGLILAGIMESLLGLGMKVIILIITFMAFRTIPSPTLALGIIGMGLIFSMGTAIGLLMAPWNALHKDLDNVMNVFPWVFMALTPVFVQPQTEGILWRLYQWNPFTHLFNATRFFTYEYGHAITGNGTLPPHLSALLLAFITSLILIPLAWGLCRIARPYVMESALL